MKIYVCKFKKELTFAEKFGKKKTFTSSQVDKNSTEDFKPEPKKETMLEEQKSNKKETKVIIQDIQKNIELESTLSDTETVIPNQVPTEINLDDIEF